VCCELRCLETKAAVIHSRPGPWPPCLPMWRVKQSRSRDVRSSINNWSIDQ